MDAKDYWSRALPLIRERGYTQQSFSIKCGFTRRRIETLIARSRFPEANESEAIAAELGTTNTYLVTGKDPAKPDVSEAIRHIEIALDDLKKR